MKARFANSITLKVKAARKLSETIQTMITGKSNHEVSSDCQANPAQENDTALAVPSPDSSVPELPSVSEDFELIEEIGCGGMSTVYKAKQKMSGRLFALKLMHRRFANDEPSLLRFQREVTAAQSLSNPHLVTVYESGIAPSGQPFLVMDLIEGTTLSNLIETEKAIDSDRLIAIMLQMCEALSHAHARGVMHRDLKPSNVLLIQSPHSEMNTDFVKVVDFGIAGLIPEAETDAQRMTQTGELIGSPIYMSPEQCQGRRMDARSDIYSLGCIMYEALTGRPPFLGDNIVQTILQHLNDSPRSFADVCPSRFIPEAVEQIVSRCLSKNPADRFQCVDELKESLEIVDTSTSDVRKDLIFKQRKRRIFQRSIKQNAKRLWWSMAAVFAVISTVFVWLMHERSEQQLLSSLSAAKEARYLHEHDKSVNLWKAALGEALRLGKQPQLVAAIHKELGSELGRTGRKADAILAQQELKRAAALYRSMPGARSDLIEALRILNNHYQNCQLLCECVETGSEIADRADDVTNEKLERLMKERNYKKAIDMAEKELSSKEYYPREDIFFEADRNRASYHDNLVAALTSTYELRADQILNENPGQALKLYHKARNQKTRLTTPYSESRYQYVLKKNGGDPASAEYRLQLARKLRAEGLPRAALMEYYAAIYLKQSDQSVRREMIDLRKALSLEEYPDSPKSIPVLEEITSLGATKGANLRDLESDIQSLMYNYEQSGRYEDAMHALKRGTDLRPVVNKYGIHPGETHARLLLENGNVQESLFKLRELVADAERKKDHQTAYSRQQNVVKTLLICGDVDGADRAVEKLRWFIPGNFGSQSSMRGILPSDPLPDPALGL